MSGGGERAIVLWRRIDTPGFDWAELSVDERVRISGVALFAHDGLPVRLEYAIVCDREWRTLSARVIGAIGSRAVDLTIRRDGERNTWRLDGSDMPAVEGCVDVDLAFTPATNALPIRRLALPVGSSSAVRAAWLRFPELDLVLLEQAYRRTGARMWRYESDGGRFVRDLEVDGAGFVVRYPGLWERATA